MMDLEQKSHNILITGGTGFIGSRLVNQLLKLDQKVTILTRQKNLPSQQNLTHIFDLNEAEFDFDVVINLSGETISQKWTESAKNKIRQSRIDLTKKLVDKINSAAVPPKVFISGSAVGYYGAAQERIFTENTRPSEQNLFSQRLCFDWENEAKKVTDQTRLVLLRTGVVIGKNGGIIKKMFLPFYLGLGGKISSGQQYISWIHLDDAINAIIFLIEKNSIHGPVNLVAPSAVSNAEFSTSLAKALNRLAIFTIPAISMKLAYGKMAEELLLSGQKVYPEVLTDADFEFKFVDVFEAIKASI